MRAISVSSSLQAKYGKSLLGSGTSFPATMRRWGRLAGIQEALPRISKAFQNPACAALRQRIDWPSQAMNTTTRTVPEADLKALDLEAHRPHLLRFALLHLRDQSHAEDAVQDSLVAAIQSADGFRGQSTVRTWLIGILKHKIIDHVRRSIRDATTEPSAAETSVADFDGLFAGDGHWSNAPSFWEEPDRQLEQRRFFDALEVCLQTLPVATARAFTMREIFGMETEDICRELRISSSNCWVMLYRARMVLRECLEVRWFGNPSARRAGT